jgi:hypothetical protein
LKVDVECLGEKSGFKIKWPDVVLFAARMEDGVEGAIKGIEMGTAGLGIEQEGGLPRYQGGSRNSTND